MHRLRGRHHGYINRTTALNIDGLSPLSRCLCITDPELVDTPGCIWARSDTIIAQAFRGYGSSNPNIILLPERLRRFGLIPYLCVGIVSVALSSGTLYPRNGKRGLKGGHLQISFERVTKSEGILRTD